MRCLFFAANRKGISTLENLGAMLMLEVATLRAFDFSSAARKWQRGVARLTAQASTLVPALQLSPCHGLGFFIGDLEISDAARKDVEKGEKRLKAQTNTVACVPCLLSRPHLMPPSGHSARRGSLYG